MQFPNPFAGLFSKPSAEAMLQTQLEEARRERTLASMQREHWAATERMLDQRVARIEKELKQ